MKLTIHLQSVRMLINSGDLRLLPHHAFNVSTGTTKPSPLIYVRNKEICLTTCNSERRWKNGMYNHGNRAKSIFGCRCEDDKNQTIWLSMRHCFPGYRYELFSPSFMIGAFRQTYERRNGTSGGSIMSVDETV